MLSEEEMTGGAMKATSVSPKLISIFPPTDLMSRECRLIEDVAAHEGLIGCVLPYLAAKDTLRLDTAIGTKDTRAFLKKAYVGLRSPGFDAHVYSDRNNFKGFHWVMERSVVLQNLKLEYKGEWENQNEVLHKLVIDQNKSMATNLATMSTVKNTEILYKWRSSSTLVEAAKLDYIEVVKQLMERGADVNECNKWRNTPLIEASWHNNPEMVKTLLAYGAEVNRPNFAGVLPIFAAAQTGSLPIVQTLLAAGASVDAKRGCGTPLYTASSGGYVDVIRALLAAGAAINQAANDDCTPLYMAACTGRAHAVKVLLEEGANPSMGDSRGETPLHAAACRGQIEAVRELVDATESAGVNLDLRTQDGKTPLLWASWHEQVEIVQLLLNKGADPLRPDHAGNTPLSVSLALEAEADTFEARDLRNQSQSQSQGQGQDGHNGAGSPLGYSSGPSPSPTYARSPHRLPLITLGSSRLGASTPGMAMPIPSTSSSGSSSSSAVGLSPISDLHSNSEEEESEADLAMISEESQVRLIARDRYSSYAYAPPCQRGERCGPAGQRQSDDVHERRRR
jgi:ankyrin repeat protein